MPRATSTGLAAPVLAAGLAAASALAAGPASAGSPLDYPRLANMYWPLHVDSTVVQALAKWDVVVVNSVWSNAQLAQLRALNPAIKIYFYVIAYTVELPPAGGDEWKLGNYEYAATHDLWWYDKNGGVGSDWPNTRMCNVTSLGPTGPLGSYREFIAARMEDLVATHPELDGVFLDNFWEMFSWQQQFRQLDSDCNPTHNAAGCDGVADTNAQLDGLWNTAMRQLAQDLRARFDILQAGRPRPLAILTNNATDYFESLNGAMIEYFPSAHSNVDYGNAFQYNWNEEMLNAPGGYLTTPFNPVPELVQVLNGDWWGALWQPARSLEFERHKRFTLGSALLGDGYYSLDAGESFGHGNLWWEPEYDHAGRGKGWLGQPLGPPVRLLQPTGPEIIANGDFSAGLDDWVGLAFDGAGGGVALDTQAFHSPPASVRLQLDGAGPGSIGYIKLWQDPVPVALGQTYTLRFWAKADAPRQKIELHLYSEDCPSVRCWGDRRFWIPAEWTPIEMSFASTGTAAAGLNLFLRANGNVWLDDISLRAGDTTLYRRDFEHGVVLLNYTNTARTVDLGGTYWRPKIPLHPVFDGARVTSEVVPLSDVRIVLRDSVPDLPRDTSGVSDSVPPARRRNVLEQNEPNPFNPTTVIAFELDTDADVDLAVYDVAGRRIRALAAGRMRGGVRHRIEWDGRDDAGGALASGLYLYRLRTPAFASTRKMVLVR